MTSIRGTVERVAAEVTSLLGGWLDSVAPKIRRVEAIEARVPELDRELKAERHACVPRDEFVERVRAWIEARAREYATAERSGGRTFARAVDLLAPLMAWERPRPPGIPDVETLGSLLFWLLLPELKRNAPQAIAQLVYAQGRSSAGRPAQLAAL
jgi:hypothetical protein